MAKQLINIAYGFLSLDQIDDARLALDVAWERCETKEDRIACHDLGNQIQVAIMREYTA